MVMDQDLRDLTLWRKGECRFPDDLDNPSTRDKAVELLSCKSAEEIVCLFDTIGQYPRQDHDMIRSGLREAMSLALDRDADFRWYISTLGFTHSEYISGKVSTDSRQQAVMDEVAQQIRDKKSLDWMKSLLMDCNTDKTIEMIGWALKASELKDFARAAIGESYAKHPILGVALTDQTHSKSRQTLKSELQTKHATSDKVLVFFVFLIPILGCLGLVCYFAMQYGFTSFFAVANSLTLAWLSFWLLDEIGFTGVSINLIGLALAIGYLFGWVPVLIFIVGYVLLFWLFLMCIGIG